MLVHQLLLKVLNAYNSVSSSITRLALFWFDDESHDALSSTWFQFKSKFYPSFPSTFEGRQTPFWEGQHGRVSYTFWPLPSLLSRAKQYKVDAYCRKYGCRMVSPHILFGYNNRCPAVCAASSHDYTDWGTPVVENHRMSHPRISAPHPSVLL